MEDWSVSDSDTGGEENDEQASETCLDFGGIMIPPQRLVELMQSVQQRKTVELDSLTMIYKKKRHKKKKRKKSASRVGGAKSLEDASETASEIRSTTCTSTSATECRDTRRPKFDSMFDDPELDDNAALGASKMHLPIRIKKAPPPTHRKGKQLASLDKITADVLKRKQRWRNSTRSELTKTDANHSEVHNNAVYKHPTGDRGGGLPRLSFKEEEEEDMEVDCDGAVAAAILNEGNSEGDLSESDSDTKLSLALQLNKVEQLLDFEVA